MADNRRFLGGSNEHFQSMNVKNQLLVTNELVELVKFVQNNPLNKGERRITFQRVPKINNNNASDVHWNPTK